MICAEQLGDAVLNASETLGARVLLRLDCVTRRTRLYMHIYDFTHILNYVELSAQYLLLLSRTIHFIMPTAPRGLPSRTIIVSECTQSLIGIWLTSVDELIIHSTEG